MQQGLGFLQLGALEVDSGPTTSKGGRTFGGVASKRVRKELQSAVDGGLDGIHLFPSVSADGTTPNFRRLRAIIEGPRGSVFEGGTFVLEGS